MTGGNLLLGPLGNYGGQTQTMPLLPGSPAIDAGISGAGIPTTDQRGKPRVGGTDIGAFESQGFTLTPVAGSTPQTVAFGTEFANLLAVTVTSNNKSNPEPVNGGVVSFTNPSAANSPRAIFTDPNSATGYSLTGVSVTIVGSQATVAAAASYPTGNYTVTASTTGALDAAFALTNTLPSSTLVVNTTSNSLFAGPGLVSLPLAILVSNSFSVASTITFDPTVFATPQTITLTGQQLELTNTAAMETITGPAAGVTVSGGGLSRVFQVDSGVTASFSGLTITGGGNVAGGGGLLNKGTLSLTNCTLSGNVAQGGGRGGAGQGGAIFNYAGATLGLTNCTLSGNLAHGGFGGYFLNSNHTRPGGAGQGGAIFNNSSVALNLTNCTLSGNAANGGDTDPSVRR